MMVNRSGRRTGWRRGRDRRGEADGAAPAQGGPPLPRHYKALIRTGAVSSVEGPENRVVTSPAARRLQPRLVVDGYVVVLAGLLPATGTACDRSDGGARW
ncbi:hypothetical protein GCM10010182_71170 [Actinomadura cremea]|nr:hypothetical protein GCM10010182_71170 [Actinomadura cremea]